MSTKGKLTKLPRAEQWADRICAQQAKSVESIIEVGRLLVKAKADLEHGEWGRLFEDGLVPFGVRTAQRLMVIAEHQLLSNTTHASYLPASWMTLYELTKADPSKLKNALKDGVITPDMPRKAIVALLPAGNAKPPVEFHWLNAIGDLKDLIERVVSKWPDDARALVPRALRDLAESMDAERVDRGDRDNATGAGGSAPITIDATPAP